MITNVRRIAAPATPMISYAQNAEDVVLARALAETQRGFYIDVGAFHPSDHSVTRHFYDRGWRGINLEPVPHLLERFETDRPDDVNIGAGVLDVEGMHDLWEGANAGASTLVEEHVTDEPGWQRRTVPVLTLASVCRDHVGDRTIDFLKIDAEGAEAAVIRGADWSRWQPRIVVVEATRPHRREHAHQEWEPLLTDAGYVFALFDGLNRFYARAGDAELLELLDRPASVFDDFITHEVAVLREQVHMKDEYISGLEQALEAASRSRSRVQGIAGKARAALRRQPS